ncbi:fibronectin type III domain-containing protein [Lysinibacillus sp. 54212]|uniref:fibronectin type III domain-containing protein n=1 Tax=Lysinibacillus sp. 54212 TaxID=3119829 RepID=UPI002FCA3E3F
MHFKKKTLFILGLILLLVVNSLQIPKVEAAINEQPIHNYSQNTWAFNSLAKGPNGEIYLAHKVSHTEIVVKRWDEGKWTLFSTITTAETNNTSFSDDLDLMVDSFGKLHIVFRHENGTGIASARGISYGYHNGASWVFNEVDSSSDPYGWKNYDDPSLAVDSNGKAHIVYNYTDSNGSRIYSAKYATNISGNWNKSTLVIGNGTIGIDEIHQPQIEIDASNIAHVTYVREDNQNNYYGNYYYTSKAVNEPTFPPATKIVDAVADGKNYFYSPFAVTAAGKIFFTSDAYVNNSSTSYLHSNTSGKWEQEQVYTDSQRETYPVGVSILDSTVHLLMYSVAKDNSDVELFAITKNNNTLLVGNKIIKPNLVVSPPLNEITFIVDSHGNFITVMEHNTLKTISSLFGTSPDFGLSKPLSTNSELNNLEISNGTLSPTFSASTTSYFASVANNVSSIAITPTLADSKATLVVNGNSVTSGQPVNVSLNIGANTIQGTVTAEDGVTTKTYTVTINRAALTPPSAPTNIKATPGNEEVTISFDAPTENGGKPITGYTVKVYSGGAEQTSLNKTGATSPITVNDLKNGTPYTFKVVASNEVGDSPASNDSTAITPRTIPDAPTIGTAISGNGQATVSFTAPASNGGSAITAYTVKAYPGGVTATGSQSPIIVSGLTNGTGYTFTVTATNAAGTSSASGASNVVTPATVPNAPQNVVGTPGDKQVKVSFNSPTDNGGSSITDYKVKVFSGGVELPLLNRTGNTSPITITGLTNGTPYTFKVVALNALGEGAESTVSNAVTPSSVPDAPTSISATKGNAEATVSFTAPTNDGGNPITGYTVKVFKDGAEQTSLNKSGSASPITVTGLTNGTPYTFKVVATNIVGNSKDSEASPSIVPMTVPDKPTNVNTTTGDAQVKIDFTPPVNNGGSSIIGYVVKVFENGVEQTSLNKSGSSSPITISNLTNGSPYTFKVIAKNSVGESAASDETIQVTPAANQLAPLGLKGIAPTAPSLNDGKITGTSNLMEFKFNSDTTWISVPGTEIQNLTPGTYNVRLKTKPGWNAGAITNVIVPKYASPGSGGSGGSGGSSGGSIDKEDNTIILINGKEVSLGQSKTTTVDDKSITTLKVDSTKLKELLLQEGSNAVITIPVAVKSNRIISELNGEIIHFLEETGGTVVLQTPTAAYSIPAHAINIDEVVKQLGKNVELKDITIHIEISEPADQSIQAVQNTASKNGYEIILPPVEFKVSFTNGDNKAEVSRFSAYVERMMAIPDSIDPSKITTGVRLNEDGTFSHVPTSIVKIGGKFYAKINSLTNSIYTVISSPKQFKDVISHWAKDSIHNLASRLVISGVTKDNFAPNNDITRAEFAAIMVRGLGIKLGVGDNIYMDVATDAWYAEYILAATEYDLIHGYGNGNFGANDKITREQAIAIIARAMKITKLHANLKDEEVNGILDQFNDKNKIAHYAKEPIALGVKTGVVSGKGNQNIAPQDFISRAEVAVIIESLLQNSNLISK